MHTIFSMMKMPLKKILLLVTVTIPLVIGTHQLQASPVDFSIGGTVSYNWWNPAWNNRKLVLYTPDMLKIVDRNTPRYSIMRYFLYGPDISIKFLRYWEISPSFQYGESSTEGRGFALYPELVYRTITIDIKQYKTYTSIGYYILEYLKCYLGLRVELFNYSIHYKHLQKSTPLNIYLTTIDGKELHYTPEAGINITLPLSNILTIIYNLSGTIQSGSDDAQYKNSFDQYGPKYNFNKIHKAHYLAAGGNTSLALKINIPIINTSVTLGAFYRMLRYFQKTTDRGFFDLDGAFDHNYGVMCSVSYTFSFGKRKKLHLWIPRPNYE
jgi:hypothetical protein